jgi:hypothetical protein
MDGMHDLGGKQGFGPVRFTHDAPTFHADWEKRVNALYSFAVKLGVFNMDEYRHAIERMEPRHYLNASYYERSLTGLASSGARAARFRSPRRARRAARTRLARNSSRETACVCATTTFPATCACPVTSAARPAWW